MGFLELGIPFSWIDSLEWVAYVRTHGIQQFLHVYDNVKEREGDRLKWGDEVSF